MAVDVSRREHELVANKNDPARYLTRRLEFLRRAAAEIDHLGLEAIRGDRSNERLTRNERSVGSQRRLHSRQPP